MTGFRHTDRAFQSFMRVLEILPWPGQGGAGLLPGELAWLSQALPHPALLCFGQGQHRYCAALVLAAEVEVPEDKPSEHKHSVTLPKVVGGWYSLADQIIK